MAVIFVSVQFNADPNINQDLEDLNGFSTRKVFIQLLYTQEIRDRNMQLTSGDDEDSEY